MLVVISIGEAVQVVARSALGKKHLL